MLDLNVKKKKSKVFAIKKSDLELVASLSTVWEMHAKIITDSILFTPKAQNNLLVTKFLPDIS